MMREKFQRLMDLERAFGETNDMTRGEIKRSVRDPLLGRICLLYDELKIDSDEGYMEMAEGLGIILP